MQHPLFPGEAIYIAPEVYLNWTPLATGRADPSYPNHVVAVFVDRWVGGGKPPSRAREWKPCFGRPHPSGADGRHVFRVPRHVTQIVGPTTRANDFSRVPMGFFSFCFIVLLDFRRQLAVPFVTACTRRRSIPGYRVSGTVLKIELARPSTPQSQRG